MKNNSLTYQIEDYDSTKKLIIDPVIEWSTYYTCYFGNDIKTDSKGNIYLTGLTYTGNSSIPYLGHQTNYGGGFMDGFLVKFNSNGTRRWATYYGGSGDDYISAIDIDSIDNVFVAGVTSSSSNIS